MVNIAYIICSVLSFIPALVLHEVAHGFAAWKLGDPTAKSRGRLSLNPLKHIDPFGTVLLPAMLMFMNMPVFGYAYRLFASSTYNIRQIFRNPFIPLKNLWIFLKPMILSPK